MADLRSDGKWPVVKHKLIILVIKGRRDGRKEKKGHA